VPSVAQSPFNEAALLQMGVAEPGNGGLDGSGILIGFADYGFDILHPCLLDAVGSHTRFAFVWDQNATFRSRPDSSPDPGVIDDLDRARLDALVARARQEKWRAAADAIYDPHANYFSRGGVGDGAHGTMMASIAAGTPFAGLRGVAPGADLIGVQLALPEPHWKEVDGSGVPTWTGWDPAAQPVWKGWRSYDESIEIIAALDYIYAKAVALDAPAIVINLSIGAWAGAHDGCATVDRKIADLVARGEAGEGPACAVVVVAGNAGADDGHFAADVSRAAPAEPLWRMNADDPTQNKLEVWYEAQTPLRITLALGERARSLASFPLTPGPTHTITLGGRMAGIADHVPGARGPLSRARILLHPPYFPPWLRVASGGEIAWTLRLETDGDACVPLHVWLERDDGVLERSTLAPSHPSSTLAPFACAEGAIAVAGYDHGTCDGGGIFAASGLGPRPWQSSGRDASPVVAAPGNRIWGARSKTQGFALTSGTSASCAFVSGAIALLMQEALREGRRPSREALIASLSGKSEAASRSWSPRFGYGPARIRRHAGEACG
jgi:hypothetical protein